MPYPDDQPNGASHDGADREAHANGAPLEDHRWWRSVVENSSENVTIVDVDGTLRYASPAFGKMLGFDPKEVVGKMNVLEHVHPEDLPRVLEETEKALGQGGVATNRAEYRFRCKDGSWRWVESIGTYLLDDPEVGGVVVQTRDVTERKRAEEALKESERRFSGVLSSAHAYVYRCLNEPGYPNEYASDYALELTGYPPEELLVGGSVRYGDLIVEEDRDTVWSEVQEALGQHRGFELRYALRRKDGEVRNVLEHGQGVYDEDGRVVALEGIVHDVTSLTEAEVALIESEERYRTLVERVPAITYVHHHEPGRFSGTTYVSPQVETVLGYTPEEYTSDPEFWTTILHPEDRERVLAEDERTVLTREPFDQDYRMIAKDGRAVWLRESGTFLRTEDDGTQVWHGVMFDITELKWVEQGLRDAEERYRTLVERVPAIIYIQKPKEGQTAAYDTTYISPRVEDVLGYPPQRFVEDPGFWDEVIYPEDRQKVAEENERTDRTGEPFSLEYRLIAKDKRVVWVKDEATLVQDEAGKPLYWLGVQVDITGRRYWEEALRDAEERYRTLVEQIPAVTYIVPVDDPDSSLYISPQIEKMLGYTTEEWISGKLWPKRLHREDRERVLTADERFEAGLEERFREVYRLIAKDGRVVWVHDEAVVLRDGAGEPLFWQGVIFDVTERKEAEEALKQSEERYRRQSRELALLHRVRTALARELDEVGVLYGAVEAVAEAYGYTHVSAYLLEREELVLQHLVGYEQTIERIPTAKGVAGRVVRSGRPVLVEDVGADPDYLGDTEEVSSEVCVPLLDEGTVVGILNVEGTGGVRLTRNDLRLMIAVGEHVGVALSRARLHARVRHSEERYRALAQNSSDIVTLVTATGTIVYQSPAAERILGYGAEEMVGKNCFDYVHPEDVRRVEMAFAEGLKLPERRPSVEYRIRHKEGSWRWLESVGTNLLGHPAVGAYVVNSRDVTERRKSEEALKQGEDRLRVLFENSSDLISLINSDNTFRYISPSVRRLLGYEPEELEGRLVSDMVHPEDFERFGRQIVEQIRSGVSPSPRTIEGRYRHKDGSWLFMETTFNVLIDDPDVRGVVCTTRDVTERKRVEVALRESEQRFKASFENAATGMALVAPDGRFLRVNRSLCEILGYSAKDLLRKTFQELAHPDDLRADDLEHLRRLLAGEIRTYQMEKRYLHKDGHVVWALLSVSLVQDEEGEPLYFVTQIQDVSARKRMEEWLARQAFHDSLTGLPNRHLFVDRLAHALERTRRMRDRKVAVLFMDLDGFKVINDSLGHDVGDRVLEAVSERLTGCLRPEDTLARFGGDEFVVLIEEVEEPAEAVRVAERITGDLRQPLSIGDRQLFTRASIGIALGDVRSKTPEDLLRDADTAMYRAKESGTGYSVFDPVMYLSAVGRLEMESDLRRAVEAKEFVVHYQPIVSLMTGEVWGFEALVRWDHPERGLLAPYQFVPVAEERGLVVPLGEAVLEEACRRAVKWQEGHPQALPLVMSVNLSAKQIVRPDLAETVERVLRETGLEAGCLSLDITETVYIKALEGNTLALNHLKELGIGISIDDFGTGYSSLSYLKSLPADVLKIDKSFVEGLGEDMGDTAIVRMIIELANSLGMKVIAEGVEEWAQAALLLEMGCELAQGYYFSRPLPLEKVSAFLAE